MPPKKGGPNKGGGKNANAKTNTGRGNQRRNNDRDGSRRNTIFRTNSIGHSANNAATAKSLHIEVENRAGEGYVAQALLKMFHDETARARLIAFLKVQEPHAITSGWSVPATPASATAPQSAQVVAMLSLLAAQNNPDSITPKNVPNILAALGLSATDAAAAGYPTVTTQVPAVAPTVAPTASTTTPPLLNLLRSAFAKSSSLNTTGTPAAAAVPGVPAPASAGAVSASTGSIGSSASSVSSSAVSLSPGPLQKDTVRNIARMILTGGMTMSDAQVSAGACDIAFSRVIQSLQSQRDKQTRASPRSHGAGLGPLPSTPGPTHVPAPAFTTLAPAPARCSTRIPAPAPALASELAHELAPSGVSSADPFDLRMHDEYFAQLDASLRSTADSFGIHSGASSLASSRHASPSSNDFSEDDLRLGITKFFSRKNGDISRSKVKGFLAKHKTAMDASGLSTGDLPTAGAGYHKNTPESTMVDAARMCVHHMYATTPGLLVQLQHEASLVDTPRKHVSWSTGTSPASSVGTPARTPAPAGPAPSIGPAPAVSAGSIPAGHTPAAESSIVSGMSRGMGRAPTPAVSHSSASLPGASPGPASLSSLRSTSRLKRGPTPATVGTAPKFSFGDGVTASVGSSGVRRSLDQGFASSTHSTSTAPLPQRERKRRARTSAGPATTPAPAGSSGSSGHSSVSALDLSVPAPAAVATPASKKPKHTPTTVASFFLPKGGHVFTGPGQQPVIASCGPEDIHADTPESFTALLARDTTLGDSDFFLSRLGDHDNANTAGDAAPAASLGGDGSPTSSHSSTAPTATASVAATASPAPAPTPSSSCTPAPTPTPTTTPAPALGTGHAPPGT
jgi:hypothetical protein